MAYQEVDISTITDREINKSLCIPSGIHAYSLAIQYMQNWFLSKMPDGYFKSVYVNDKNVFDDFRTMNQTQQLKRLKPSLAIIPQIEWSFDHENIYSIPYGINMLTKRSKFDDAFYKDKSKHVYLGLGLEANLINFTFKVRLSTRAQQMDLFKFMRLAYRVGYTQGEYIDMDFHVPYNLVIQLARDTGYTIENNKIKNVVEFINHLNNNSTLPFLYKYRCINGNNEFFIRLKELYVHISTPDISADDGEREGHLSNNYVIEMQSVVRFPSPQFYAYYSENKHMDITFKEEVSDPITAFTVKIMDVPEVNAKGWNQYITTEYEEENLEDRLVIDFNELFSGDLRKVIDYNISIGLSPDMFMEMKLYNGAIEIDYDMDWKTLTLTTKHNPVESITFISIYVDLNYMNKYLISSEAMLKDRIN